MAMFTIPIKLGEVSNRVDDAQWLCAGNNKFRIKTYMGKIDKHAGPATVTAFKLMKYKIGYPESECHPTFGQTLYEYLTGKRTRSAAMVARAKARQVTRPARCYPITGYRRRIIGYPGQGTHSYTRAPHNWQSDRAYDLAVPVGTPIVAVEAGTIGPRWGDLNSWNPALAGMRLSVENALNSIYYAHLSRLLKRPGVRVKAGDLLGYSGMANGVPHLHIATRVGPPSTVLLGGTVVGRPLGLLNFALPGDETEMPDGITVPVDWEHGEVIPEDEGEEIMEDADMMMEGLI